MHAQPTCLPLTRAGGSSLPQASQRLKQQLGALCSAQPGEADDRLSAEQVGQVARQLAATALQHYSLYCLVYRQEQQHVQHEAQLMVGICYKRRAQGAVHAVRACGRRRPPSGWVDPANAWRQQRRRADLGCPAALTVPAAGAGFHVQQPT